MVIIVTPGVVNTVQTTPCFTNMWIDQTGGTSYTNSTTTTVPNIYIPIYVDEWGQYSTWGTDNVTPSQYFTLAQNRAVIYLATVQRRQEELEAARRAQQVLFERDQEQRQLALDVSKVLLLSHLTKEQRDTFEKNKWFVVVGGKTKKTYRIKTVGYSGNIEELHGEKVTHRICCHCRDTVPLYDHHLAQKLAIEFDEDNFLRVANRSAA